MARRGVAGTACSDGELTHRPDTEVQPGVPPITIDNGRDGELWEDADAEQRR